MVRADKHIALIKFKAMIAQHDDYGKNSDIATTH